MVDAVIRLFLKNYNVAELHQLYSALAECRVVCNGYSVATVNSVKDLDEALAYISGYIDARCGGDDK